MPAHVKSPMLHVRVTIPIANGKINLGTWQGIYLGEHIDCRSRKVVATIIGQC